MYACGPIVCQLTQRYGLGLNGLDDLSLLCLKSGREEEACNLVAAAIFGGGLLDGARLLSPFLLNTPYPQILKPTIHP